MKRVKITSLCITNVFINSMLVDTGWRKMTSGTFVQTHEATWRCGRSLNETHSSCLKRARRWVGRLHSFNSFQCSDDVRLLFSFWIFWQVWFFSRLQQTNIYIFIIDCAKMLIAKSNIIIPRTLCGCVTNSKSHDAHKLDIIIKLLCISRKGFSLLLLFQLISSVISYIKFFKLLI